MQSMRVCGKATVQLRAITCARGDAASVTVIMNFVATTPIGSPAIIRFA